MGKAKFVKHADDVNEKDGKFLLIPQGVNEDLLADPVLHGLIFEERLLPFFKAHGVESCVQFVNDVGSIDAALEDDVTWLAKRLSGAPVDEEDRCQVETIAVTAMVALVHRRTPAKGHIKQHTEAYELPGLVAIVGRCPIPSRHLG